MRGRTHQLKNGYYCVILADDVDRNGNKSRADMQLKADRFFSSTPPWNGFNDKGRFGVPALVTDLSRHLTAIIDERYVPPSFSSPSILQIS